MSIDPLTPVPIVRVSGDVLISKSLTIINGVKMSGGVTADIIQTRSLSYSATPNDKFREVWGSVSSAGAKTGGSSGWIVTKKATGTYEISVNKAFTSPLSGLFVSITPTQDVARFVSVSGLSQGSSTVFIAKMRGTGGGLQDTSFNFLARGSA